MARFAAACALLLGAASTVSSQEPETVTQGSDSSAQVAARRSSRVQGDSYVMLSLIKTVSGHAPRTEFSDLRLRFSGGRSFTVANIDVALQPGDDPATDRLVEAGFLWNYRFSSTSVGPGLMARLTALTLGYRMFNGVSYSTIGISGHEMRGSPLEGSYVVAALAHRMLENATIPVDSPVTDLNRPRARNNLIIDFFVRVPNTGFLDKLRIRGTILLPTARGFVVEQRIVLSVPVVDLTRF